MAEDLEKLVIRLAVDLEDVKRKYDEAQQRTESFSSTVTRSLGGAFSNLNQSIGQAVGGMLGSLERLAKLGAVSLAGLGTASLKLSMDFGRMIQNVGSLAPKAAENAQQISRSIRDMAIETGQSASDLAGGMYELVSSFGYAEDATKQLEIASKLAGAGISTVKDAIGLIAAETKAYGDTSTETMQKVSDLATVTVNLGQTTLPELANALPRVTALSAALGVSMEELHGAMATFTGVTGNAAEVATQLRGFFQALASPTDDMRKLFASLGVESGKALIEMNGMQGAIEAVALAAEQAGPGGLQALVGSIEGQQLVMAGADKQASALAANIRAMGDAAGATAKAFEVQKGGLAEAATAWDQFKERLRDIAIEIGDTIGPDFADLLDSIGADLTGARGDIQGFVEAALSAFKTYLLPGVKEVWKNIKESLAELKTAFTSFFTGDIPGYESALERAGNALGTAFYDAFMGAVERLKADFSVQIDVMIGDAAERLKRVPVLGHLVNTDLPEAKRGPEEPLAYNPKTGFGGDSAGLPVYSVNVMGLSSGLSAEGAPMGTVGGQGIDWSQYTSVKAQAAADSADALKASLDALGKVGVEPATIAATGYKHSVDEAGNAVTTLTTETSQLGGAMSGLQATITGTATGLDRLKTVFGSINYGLTSGTQGGADLAALFPHLDPREIQNVVDQWRNMTRELGFFTVTTAGNFGQLIHEQENLMQQLQALEAAAGGATLAQMEEQKRRQETEDSLFKMGLTAAQVAQQMAFLFPATQAATQAMEAQAAATVTAVAATVAAISGRSAGTGSPSTSGLDPSALAILSKGAAVDPSALAILAKQQNYAGLGASLRNNPGVYAPLPVSTPGAVAAAEQDLRYNITLEVDGDKLYEKLGAYAAKDKDQNTYSSWGRRR